MDIPSDREKARIAWGELKDRDLLFIGPLGSRVTSNTLIFNKRTGRVQTGWRAFVSGSEKGVPCYEGSLEEFEELVEKGARGSFRPELYVEYLTIVQALGALFRGEEA